MWLINAFNASKYPALPLPDIWPIHTFLITDFFLKSSLWFISLMWTSITGFDIEEIPSGSVIGSSSLRRAVQVTRKRPDVIVKPVRGNIETRIKKVEEGKFDGIVLAQAGITRLGTNTKISKLSTNDFVPSPGQGALAIVSREDNSSTLKMLKKIEDYSSRMEIEAERALSESVDSGCRFPVGAVATSDANSLTLKVAVYSMDGKKSIILEKTGSIEEPQALGRLLGDEFLEYK